MKTIQDFKVGQRVDITPAPEQERSYYHKNHAAQNLIIKAIEGSRIQVHADNSTVWKSYNTFFTAWLTFDIYEWQISETI